jgi:hypothetical protein
MATNTVWFDGILVAGDGAPAIGQAASPAMMASALPDDAPEWHRVFQSGQRLGAASANKKAARRRPFCSSKQLSFNGPSRYPNL